ncbi:MAG TPA: aminotransferase class IV [bacterium]|nr:aminotransferase class IV [bacterium]
MSGLVYFNGMLKHEHEVSQWTLDRSYLYGEGLFETMKATHGFIPFLSEHLQRFFRGLDLLRMPIDLSASKLEFALYQTLHHNRLKDAYLRLTLSRLNKEFGSLEPGDSVNLVVVAKALDKVSKKLYTDGASAKVIEDFRISPDPLCQVKSTNYLRNILSQRMAQEGGFDLALLLNSAGNLVEAATANLFIHDGEKFLTPPLSEGVLPGVTRRIILELLEKNYLAFEERPLKVSDLLTASEAFLTSALKEVLPLTRVNDKPIGRGIPGKETERIASLFNEEKQYRIESFESKKWGVE